MDPEQVRTEMRARRARIDSTLDRLQARIEYTSSRARTTAASVAAGGACLYLISKLVQRWRHRRRAVVLRPRRRLVS